MSESVQDLWRRVSDRVSSACDRAKRNPSSVRVIAVSKTFGLEEVLEAYDAGARIFGENYVQEALPKIEGFRERRPRAEAEWHFIGALQSNKAKKVVGPFVLLHSLDRWSLAEALDKASISEGKALPCLVEVNLAGESTKSGVAPENLRSFVEKVSSRTALTIAGLMVFPPPAEEPEASRPFFASARKLFGEMGGWKLPRVEAKELSMGISDDFEVAIEEGATLVRVGTAIFGTRRS